MSSSLLVCNLLVVVTSLYRMFGFVDADDGASSSDDDDYTTRTTAQTTAPATTQNLTTIDLEEPGTASERTDLRIQGQEKYQ